MQGIVDEITDTVLTYRNAINERNQQLERLAQANRGQADKIKSLEEAIAAGKEENKTLRAQALDQTDKELAKEVGAGKVTPLLNGAKGGKAEATDTPVQ